MIAYRIISAQRPRTPVSVAFELLGVWCSGFYGWQTPPRLQSGRCTMLG